MSMEHARKRIHEHRVGLGLSPEQYGYRIRVSGMTVRRVEEGFKPFLSTQAKFAADLGTTIADLFGVPTLPRMARTKTRTKVSAC